MRANANWQINEWGFDLNFIHSNRREEKRHETNPLSLYPLLDLNLEQLKIHALSKGPSQVSGQLSSESILKVCRPETAVGPACMWACACGAYQDATRLSP